MKIIKKNTRIALISQLAAFVIALFASSLTFAEDRRVDLAAEFMDDQLRAGWLLLVCGSAYRYEWIENISGEQGKFDKAYFDLYKSYGQEMPTLEGCNPSSDTFFTQVPPEPPAEEEQEPTEGEEPEEDTTNYIFTREELGQLKAHKDYIELAKTHFSRIVANPPEAVGLDYIESAEMGLQEAFNYQLVGELLIGNEYLIKGLRKFRRQNKDSEHGNKTQLELLTIAAETLKIATEQNLETLDNHQFILRSKGADENSEFPFLTNSAVVQSTDEAINDLGGLDGNIVSNDYFAFADALTRYGLSANSEAKYIFYKNNVEDIDHPPLKNFPGPEDLDINNDRVKNAAGREDAKVKAKVVGNNLYLQTVLLASLQDADAFDQNDGAGLKVQLNDTDQLYQDIVKGFNPLKLAGDFVPYQRVENFISLAKSRIDIAISSERELNSEEIQYKMNETQLRDELRNQRLTYFDEMLALTGLDIDQSDLRTREGLDHLKRDIQYNVTINNTGQMGVQWLAIEEAALQIELLNEQLQNIHREIEVEEKRNDTVSEIVLSNGKRISALTYSATAAGCCQTTVTTSLSAGYNWGGASPGAFVSGSLTVTEQINPAVWQIADNQRDISLLQAVQSASIENTNSAALIKKLLLREIELFISIRQAMVSLDRQMAILRGQNQRFDRLVANWLKADEDLANAYYNDPSYRLEATIQEQVADNHFESAMETTYYATKALEYMWSEKFNNPVLKLDGTLPEPLTVKSDPYVRAESIFSAVYAGTTKGTANLQDYFLALEEWDVKMRQLRYPERQSATARFSIRDDILGFDTEDPIIAEARFKTYIEEKRRKGLNPDNDDLLFNFSLSLADESQFPVHPNIKIKSIKLNLVSTASRSIRGSSNVSPALVDIVLMDRAFIRSFFAEYPFRDDVITYELQEGRTIDKSPFIATVEATIDGYASPAPAPNTQLETHSPAVTNIGLRLRNNRLNNQDLKLEFLSDIELEIEYTFGKPRDISWPGWPAPTGS
ncbi:MAG: hypothetical protein OXE99_15465 [Cellvibrionales bacterium]|nr:hypothetical protein [Cellvibrionales bacterium]